MKLQTCKWWFILRLKIININIFTFTQSGGLPISRSSMCLQWAKMSCLLLSVAKCGFRTILNFSLKHNLQIFVTGLYIGMFFSRIFPTISYGVDMLLVDVRKFCIQYSTLTLTAVLGHQSTNTNLIKKYFKL